ncbi:amidohydrolase family protein [Paraburkholderia metrosideri]|uniref:Amidohydrolase family protein n=1 Tax=Paraburkholderia metrosideri TaxID=580937 RepID=A0ABW9E0Q4_9BURK
MDILIKNAFVVTVDPLLGDIPDADILIRDGRIIEVRPGIGEVVDTEVIDGKGYIVAPGFVDTHHHFWQGPMRGVTADWGLLGYLGGIRLHAASVYRPEDMYAAQFHGALEALNAGVTTTADYCHNLNSPDHAEESVRGLHDSGARVVWGYGFNRPPLEAPAFSSVDDRYIHLKRFAAEKFTAKNSLVTLGICAEEPGWWPDDEYGIRQFMIARELDARVFQHCNSIRLESGVGPREAARLARLNLLGPQVTLVHLGFSDQDEWQQIADTGTTAAFTPETETEMGMGWPSIAKVKALGIPFGLGIDIVSNNSADMFFPLRFALNVERGFLNGKAAGVAILRAPLECREALHWGTLGGARALGLDHFIGSITPGKAADLVFYRADRISMVGWDINNPAATIIQQASVQDVDTVIVNGSIVKRHGRLTGDEARACRLMREASDYIYENTRHDGGFLPNQEKVFERLNRMISGVRIPT